MAMKKFSFGDMTPGRREEVASKGGKAAHAAGTAHKWTSDEARIAGAKGGAAGKGRLNGKTKVTT